LVRASAKLKPHQMTICKKCKINRPSVNLRVNDVYCKDCFLTAVHHKFRSTLGKHKAMKPGDSVCVAYSGGSSSSALVHLLKTGVESDHKKLLFSPNILYVDDGCLLNLTRNQRIGNIRSRLNKVAYSGFPVHVSLIETPEIVICCNLPIDDDQIDALLSEDGVGEMQQCIDNINENSAKEDFINTIRQRAIIEGAKSLGCIKIFTGDHSTKISIDFLAGISMGKGVNLANETGFRDNRDQVMVLRPLRDISAKELSLYDHFHGIDFLSGPNLATGKPSLFSIRKLTEEFLVGLQNDFPATLSTVFRTADKMKVEEEGTIDACILCKGPIDTGMEEHCAMQATSWSLLVSSKGTKLDNDLLSTLDKLDVDQLKKDSPLIKKQISTDRRNDTNACSTSEPKGLSSSEECCGQGDGSCKSSSKSVQPLQLGDVLDFVCYSCMRTITNCRSLQSLPRNLREEIQRATNRRDMKQEIQDFLL